ncbi:MAG: MBL fold metallo-hydrolase [Variovorax sp.]|nr:MAG: MBL fold metallo-hydrolase [Variovorax sp.]
MDAHAAIKGGDGWSVGDTGARTEEAVTVWERLMRQPPLDRPLLRVLVTHMHPDHIGMAGWLARRYDARLWVSTLEYLSCRALVSATGREARRDALQFYREADWADTAIESCRARFGSLGDHMCALPARHGRIKDGQCIRIGAHVREVVIGTGHSLAPDRRARPSTKVEHGCRRFQACSLASTRCRCLRREPRVSGLPAQFTLLPHRRARMGRWSLFAAGPQLG